jgi:hypothetical protein
LHLLGQLGIVDEELAEVEKIVGLEIGERGSLEL